MQKHFVEADLSDARFIRSDLSGAVMRGVIVDDAEIDAPWLLENGATLIVNGVDVAPYVDAELDRRFPGRALRHAQDADGIRAAWSAVELAWDAAIARAATMPDGTVDVTVDDEWSFAQTLRHLVFAIDAWIGKTVLRVEQPFHPLGQTIPESAEDGVDLSLFVTGTPPYAEVLAAYASRTESVRRLLDDVTAEQLAEERPHPWGPDHRVTVRHCLGTVLDEGWEHLRYATRDLDALAAQR
ncbi:MAG TPA: DinB family protein [Candidatus Nanopelagicales bacterium]|nr:DinB family protein [Candidatus Nanopelagicales bacterium]